MSPHDPLPPDWTSAWIAGILLIILLAFYFLFAVGCASAPLKVGVPHTIRTNEFLATYEIRLRGTEETIIVGRHENQETPTFKMPVQTEEGWIPFDEFILKEREETIIVGRHEN